MVSRCEIGTPMQLPYGTGGIKNLLKPVPVRWHPNFILPGEVPSTKYIYFVKLNRHQWRSFDPLHIPTYDQGLQPE